MCWGQEGTWENYELWMISFCTFINVLTDVYLEKLWERNSVCAERTSLLDLLSCWTFTVLMVAWTSDLVNTFWEGQVNLNLLSSMFLGVKLNSEPSNILGHVLYLGRPNFTTLETVVLDNILFTAPNDFSVT